MDEKKHNVGLTLVEILVVVGIIVVLASLVIAITLGLENKSKENTLAHTFAVLESALEQFRDFGYTYRAGVYSGYEFPLDCTGFPEARLEAIVGNIMGATTSVDITNHVGGIGGEYQEYSGCEVMYLLLSEVPGARETLKAINPSLVTNENEDGQEIELLVDLHPARPFLRVVDPWGTTLQYDYYDVEPPPDLTPVPGTEKHLPVLIAAGPDRQFGTGDDITSRGR